MRVVLTRPAAEAGRWAQDLQARGFTVLAWPLIEIVPVADAAPLQQARAGLAACRAAMFVSANAAAHFLQGVAWPPGVRAWATGPGTVRALQAAGVPAQAIDAPPQDAAQFDSETLWQQVGAGLRAGDRVLLVRGAGEDGAPAGRDWLARQLEQAGAEPQAVAAYQRRAPAWDAAQCAAAQAAASDGSRWLFSSSEAIANLLQLLPGQDWAAAVAVATHERIAQTAQAAGFGRVLACRPTLEAVAATLESAG